MNTDFITETALRNAATNVIAAKPEFAKIMDSVGEEQTFAFGALLSVIFTPFVSDLERVPYHVAYRRAMFDIAPLEMDDFMVAMVDELTKVGGDLGAKTRARKTCNVL